MKNKQVTAIFLAAVMTLSSCMSMSSVTAFAAENSAMESTETAEETELVTQNSDDSEVQEETNTGSENSGEQTSGDLSDPDAMSEDPVDVSDEDSDISEAEINDEADSEDASNAITDGETSSEDDDEETSEQEEEKKDALADGSVTFGKCGAHATWTLTGPENAYTLTISGTGDTNSNIASSQWNDYYQDVVTVIIEDGISEIDENLFKGFGKLESITIPNSVTSIGWSAFSGCSKLTSITIPNGVTYINTSTFSGCSSLQSISIPDSVKAIWGEAFQNCSSLQSIIIPNSVTEICFHAFNGCSSLKSLTVPDSVKSIEFAAFANCTSLESIVLPDGLEEIERSTFSGCSKLQSIDIPDSVTSIGYSAFSNCDSLQSITIPDSVTSIDGSAFWSCDSLKTITMSGSVASIGAEAFESCKSLQSIDLPDSVTSLGESVFYNCENLQSVNLPNRLPDITKDAFNGCKSLQSIIIPDSVTSIGEQAFDNCVSLQNIVIPDSVTSIGDRAFLSCKGLKSVSISANVTSIGASTFSGCSSLQSVTFPDGVTSIGQGAFTFCSELKSLTIPGSVISIGNDAFNWCNHIKDIYYAGTKAEWDSIDGSNFYLKIKNLLLHTSDGVFGAVGAEAITLNKTSATLVKGDSLQLKATVTPADAADGNVTWKTSNSRYLTVSNTGLVKAVAAGTAIITASTGDGSLSAICTIKVVNPYTIKFNKAATKATLSTTSKKVIPGNAIGTLPTPKYAGYYFQGWYTAKTGGTKVTVSTKPAKSMTLYAHWVKVQSLAKATVTVASCTYNTKAQKPKVTVKLGGKTLKAGNDYTLTYAGNKNATKKATVTVKGKNAYNGSVKKTFTINQRDISKSPVSIKLKKTKFGYTGKAIKPGYTAVITVDGKSVNLIKGTDFTVAYKNNTRVGTASVVFTGKGNYKGTKTVKFSILKKATITLNLNKGSNSRVTPKLPAGSKNTIEILAGEKIGKIPNPTRKGYKFVGWYTTPKATGGHPIVSERTIFSTEETKNRSIYARWKKNTYKISFEYGDLVGQDQMFSLPAEMTYDVEKAVNLPILTSEYAKFNGWKEIKGAVAPENCFTVFGKTPTVGNKVLYLDCTNYSYSIEFSGGEGGSVSNMPGIYFTWHSKNTLPKASYTPPTGKTFDKWYCTENGQYYQDGAEFDRLTTRDGTVFHFVAVWKEALGESAVEYARQWLGKIPYGPSSGNHCDVSDLTITDCSGFVCGVYYHFNVDLWYFKGEIRNSPLVTNIGTKDYNQAKPGDIIWWEETDPGQHNGHVAIYAGDGYMIEETSGGHDGVYGNVMVSLVSRVANNRPISGIFRVINN